MKNRIYLDNMSTTRLDPRVLEVMMPFLTGEQYGNPHSSTHSFGWEARDAIQVARKQIADVIGAQESEIIFTSGATESNNLAIKGSAKFHERLNKKHIITAATEHKCVLDTCRHLAEEGYKITYLPVNKLGQISLDDLRNAISPDTLLVSIMAINNEIGTIQPIAEIGEICRSANVIFHTDAAQAFGKIPLDVQKMKIDLLSISGHKIYAPKGIGALYVGKKPRIRLKPLINGGSQERGFRSGTLPTHQIVGFGEAARLASLEMAQNYAHVSKLSQKLCTFLKSCEQVYINGDPETQYPGCINASFAHVEGESLMGYINHIAVSSGSACTSDSLESSYVLNAIKVDEALSHTSIRFGIGKYTTEAEIDETISELKEAIHKLRAMSPLWEMSQNGIDISQIKWTGHHH